MLFSKPAAKIGRGPSVCCRCVWNSNSLILRYNDNGKQGITLTEWWPRQLQPIFMEGVALTAVLLPRCCPFLKVVKLKSHVAGNSSRNPPPPFSSPGTEERGKGNKSLDRNGYISLKKNAADIRHRSEGHIWILVAVHRCSRTCCCLFWICLCWLNRVVSFPGITAGRIWSGITGDLVSWWPVTFQITRHLAGVGCHVGSGNRSAGLDLFAPL